ncbi:glycosyl hydrolase [Pyrinomonas methylaliphatogenes]|uniref:Glycosyl hydrolases family 2 n=1 Tax=Pyrinomonas methylaliphatogenes TaxID=454194 RepID=A0A0B6WSI7_9BACT|nr:glycosyl hydrolase [Pyrinomonas methylaliphatogenes]CDM64188.1 glycosyl hydrolases family 2 [Pyrinomonas methylaliphatogenes]
MAEKISLRTAFSLLIFVSLLSTNIRADLGDLERGFERPPDDCRIMMRWWWFGPAVTTRELEREMRLMKDGGIGGFEVQPVYPLLPDDPVNGFRNLPFLSDEFIAALRFTYEKARELGLRMDLTLGSGWPFGGPQVGISDAAGMLRVERAKVRAGERRVPLPYVTSGERLIAIFVARTDERGELIASSLREITETRDGAVYLDGEDAPRELLFFISSRTGMQVKRPAVGAEGYVLNHLDRSAVERYLQNVGERLLSAFPSGAPYAVFCDSLEVYNQDWTDDLLEEFRRRRGYDLKPYLPALVADIGPQTAAIRHDWAKTLTELLNERFLAPLESWAARHATRVRAQVYGVPAAVLSSNARIDLPEGEGHQWRSLSATRWASSASHIYGRQVTSSETWTWLHSPVFRATPLDVKAEADLHFLQGINQLIGHGWPYTAEGVEYPGWRFYAAGVFNEKNPWWIVMPDLALYLQRLSFMMRQGRPVNDVAIYLPTDDAWARSSAGRVNMIEHLRAAVGPDVVARVLEAGYGFDFFDDEALMRAGRIERGALVLGDNRYRIVILPGVERIPLETLRRLEDFARSGGVLVATRRRPSLAPGFAASEEERRAIEDVSRRLFEGEGAPARFIPMEDQGLTSALQTLAQPDVQLSPKISEIGFVHRRTDDAEIYLLVNTSNARRIFKATFRVQKGRAERWDPLTGRRIAIEAERTPQGLSVALDLAPYESCLIVFTDRALPIARNDELQIGALDLSSDWNVAFAGGPSIQMRELRSWTELEATRYFSGTATYEKEFDLPAEFARSGVRVKLDLGEGRALEPKILRSGMQAWYEGPVREAAVVYVNGQRVGSVWAPPYALDVTGFLRPGRNRIHIEVANLAVNYMAGRKLPDYRLLNLRYGERFQPQDMDKIQTVPAGLFGPIRLIATRDRAAGR